MRLTALWMAMAAGDRSVLEAAYLHRIMRERDGMMIKGRDDVAADWDQVIAHGGGCTVLADLGDMAVLRIDGREWHHWVRREEQRIAFEVLIPGGHSGGIVGDPVIERGIRSGGQSAELFHLFTRDTCGAMQRRIGSRVLGDGYLVIGKAVPNG